MLEEILQSKAVRRIIAVVIALIVIMIVTNPYYYFMNKVDSNQIGVKFQSGKPVEVVGPGLYSDWGWWVDIKVIPQDRISFTIKDDEIITKDKQRSGFIVSGDIFNPKLSEKDILLEKWTQYGTLFQNPDDAKIVIEDKARQAMKSCVGDRNFDDAVVGAARDDLSVCIEEELLGMAQNYGLGIDNIVVPEVILQPEVQARLDEITQSRLQTDTAKQNALKAKALADEEQAKQEGNIRVEQSRIQEKTRQEILTADLKRQQIEAERAVIEAELANDRTRIQANLANEQAKVEAENAVIQAQKANDLLSAQKEQEIQKAKAIAAEQSAKAKNAELAVLATIYQDNPAYAAYQTTLAQAQALAKVEKAYLPADAIPFLSIGMTGNPITPMVQVQTSKPVTGTNQ